MYITYVYTITLYVLCCILRNKNNLGEALLITGFYSVTLTPRKYHANGIHNVYITRIVTILPFNFVCTYIT